MANIKGITVEINGNVTGLEKALASVNKTQWRQPKVCMKILGEQLLQ